jgi:Transposase IS116/IS110/IS902 family
VRIREDEKALEGLLKQVQHMRSLPGMGPILAAVVVTEIDGIERFPSAQKLCGYAGLCPSTSSSGGRPSKANCSHIATSGFAGPSSRPLGLPSVARPTSGTRSRPPLGTPTYAPRLPA